MTCPNCGLANPDNARFCANCGTTLAGVPPQQPYPPPQNQWQMQPMAPRNSVGKNIAIGCLVAVLIVILFGLSCTRACFGRRRYYRYYGVVVTPAPTPIGFTRQLG
jgi:uncharacterized membrane protein YvbJ